MTTIDTTIPLQGTVPRMAGTDADPRTRAAQQRYHAVAIEHAARSETNARITTPQLSPPASKLDASTLGPMLLEIRTKLSRQQIKMGKEEIRANMKRQEVEHKKALAQIEKAIKAMAKARAEQAKAKKAGEVGKIFGWIGVAAAVVVGAAMIATGAGAVAGAMMIGIAIDQGVAMANGKQSLMDKGMEEMEKGIVKLLLSKGFRQDLESTLEFYGMPKGVAEKAVDGIEKNAKYIALAVTVMVVTGLMVAAGGLGGAEEAVESTTLEEVANAAGKAGKVTGAVADAGRGGAGIAKGVYDKKAAGDQKEADEATAKKLGFQKFLARLQAIQSDERDRLKRVIEELNESTTRVLDMMGSQQATNEQITRNLMA